MSVDVFVLPFSEPERKPCNVCVFLHQMNFIVDMLKWQEQQFKAARASDWQNGIAPEPPVNKSAFSLPKEYTCMFKAHSLSLGKGCLFLLGRRYV